DFSRVVEELTLEEQERRVAALLAARGFRTTTGAEAARTTCATDRGYPPKPGVFYRFETADLSKLPERLAASLESIQSRVASVGACAPRSALGFTGYRIAVLFS